MKREIILTILGILLIALGANSTLRTGTYDDTITFRTGGVGAGCFSNGKMLVVGADTGVYIFNTIPTGNAHVESADVKIRGFTQVGENPCIVGNKLLVPDSDSVLGGNIKIWNFIPTENTTAGSYNVRITGMPSPTVNIRTDGTKFAINAGGAVYVWNSAPEVNTDIYSASGYVSGYSVRVPWFGTSGRFYVPNNEGATATDMIYVYNNVPVSYFYLSYANSKINSTTAYWPALQSAFELRNILYLSDYPGGSAYVYVWRNIPATNSSDTLADDSYPIARWDNNKYSVDLHNIYRWNSTGYIYRYKNDYDTFSVTGANLAPSSIDKMHPNQLFYSIKAYTYPGKAWLNEIKLALTGNCADSDVSAVRVYYDANSDDSYTNGTDVLMGSAVFSGRTATIGNLNTYIEQGEKNFLVALDIGENATVGNVITLKIEHLVFEKILHEVPQNMSSAQATITEPLTPVWNKELRINYTQRDNSDTAYLISLDWDDATGGIPPLTYKIYHLVDDAVAEEFSESYSAKTVYGLEISKKHKFKVRVRDSYGNMTEESEMVYDESAPSWSGNFRISDASRRLTGNLWEYKMKVSWEAVSDNTSKDGMYEVWIKEEGKDWELKKLSWDKEVEISGLSGVLYVKVRGRDSAGNYTTFSSEKKVRMNPFLVISEESRIGVSGGGIELPDPEGGNLIIEIPDGAFVRPYDVLVEKLFESEYTYRITLKDSGIQRNIVFKKPVTMKFYYTDDKLNRLGYDKNKLTVFYNDGNKWIDIGGELNKNEKYVSVKVRRFSVYKLTKRNSDSENKVTVLPSALTPNEDGINDALFFNANWNFEGNVSVKIYDISGRQIWEYNGTDKSVVWDCRGANGKPAESGIYLYVIKVEKKTFNGTVLVAR